ncbi:MAG: V-type ATPase subunit [Rectinemataceae bacterium]|jgi:vacuolar-type H+-ATPase subunit C/Vma6
MSVRVGEAWRAIFSELPPALPEAELAFAAERGVRARAAEALRSIAGSLLREEPFFTALTRKWEFAYLKNVLAAIVERSPAAPGTEDPSLDPGFNPLGYPDLDKMLRRTRYQWVIESGLDDLPAVKNRLDRQYYSELWDSIGTIPSGFEGTIPELLRVETELENLVWGLRLKRYYSMGAADIEPLLIALDGIDVRTTTLRAVGLRADSRSEWVGWKWERLVPDARREDGGDWYFDVRGFELAARGYLYHRLYRRLHLEFESYVPLYAYFRIKEYETMAIHGIIEGIKLEAPAAEIIAFATQTTGGSS